MKLCPLTRRMQASRCLLGVAAFVCFEAPAAVSRYAVSLVNFGGGPTMTSPPRGFVSDENGGVLAFYNASVRGPDPNLPDRLVPFVTDTRGNTIEIDIFGDGVGLTFRLEDVNSRGDLLVGGQSDPIDPATVGFYIHYADGRTVMLPKTLNGTEVTNYNALGPNGEVIGVRFDDQDPETTGGYSFLLSPDGSLRELHNGILYGIDRAGWVYGIGGGSFYWPPGEPRVTIDAVVFDLRGILHEDADLAAALLGIDDVAGPLALSELADGTPTLTPLETHASLRDGTHTVRDSSLGDEVVGSTTHRLRQPNGQFETRQYAWRWTEESGGELIEEHIDPALGLRLKEAWGVTEDGRMIVQDYDDQSRWWLLTPVPEPTAMVLGSAGSALLWCRRRRQTRPS